MIEQDASYDIANEIGFVNPRLQASPYYVTCMNAFGHDNSKMIRPYEAAFIADYNGMPLCYDAAEANPRFLDVVYGAEQASPQPSVVGQEMQAAGIAPTARIFKRRAFMLILLLILSAVMLAIPILSSLALFPDYLNIGIDIFKITEMFQVELNLQTIQDYLPTIFTALFMLFALIATIASLCALFIRKKRNFIIIALLALIAAIAVILASYQFDFQMLVEDIISLDYGMYALIACPVLVIIFSLFAYKKIKY